MKFTDLLFPLNVYAWLLEAREGNADYLHFGLFHHESTTPQQSQQASTELLLAHLPAPPCHILEVGTGLGTLYGKLNFMGYSVCGINPDAAQVRIARQRLGDDEAIEICRFEDYQSDKSFDAILLQEVSQYIPIKTLFEQAAELLIPGGTLLIMDEMKAASNVESHLHCHEEYLEFAQSSGMTLARYQDLTSEAAPTVDYLLSGIHEFRPNILQELSLEETLLDGLIAALEDYKKKYASRDYLYTLYKFVSQST